LGVGGSSRTDGGGDGDGDGGDDNDNGVLILAPNKLFLSVHRGNTKLIPQCD